MNAIYSSVRYTIVSLEFSYLTLIINFKDLLVPNPIHRHYHIFLLNYNTLASNIQSFLCNKKTISPTTLTSASIVKKMLNNIDRFNALFTIMCETIARLGSGRTGRNLL